MENFKIICSNYPPEFILDKNVVKEYFKQFGKIKKITFKIKLKSFTVEYATQDGYFKALNNAGGYNGFSFNVSSAADTNKNKNNKNEFVWLDKNEVEEELAIMSGIAPTTLKAPKISSSPQWLDLKLKKKLKQKEQVSTQKKGSIIKPVVRQKGNKLKDHSNTYVSGEDIELVNLVLSQAITIEDKYRVLEARDKLMKLKFKKNLLAKSSATIGTCPDMCPEKERLFREISHQVTWYEQDDNGKTMNHAKAIKQYSRSSADQEAPLAHELRPVNVLQMTMSYLLHNIIDLCDKDEVHLGEWFHFLWDRTRGIRKDITQQELCCQGAVQLVEQCARFHIDCSARLVAEDPSVFDQKINTENLTKCLQTLKYMYNDLWLKGETCQNEAEFRAYIILLNLSDGNFMWEVQQLRHEIQRSREVQFAIQVFSAIDKNNYIKFFKLVYATTYLNACLLMRYFNQIRLMAVRTLSKCYLPRAAKTSYPLSELKSLLAFDDIESTMDFLQYCGLSCNEKGTAVILDKNNLSLPLYPYILDRSNVVENKKKNSLGRIVCGTDLPLKSYQTHIVQNSFDEKGYLINKDVLNEFDLEKVKLKLLEELDKSGVDLSQKYTSPVTVKTTDSFAFLEEQNEVNTFSTVVERKEQVDNSLALVKSKENIENSLALVKSKENTENSLFTKKEKKISNPFALILKEKSHLGSIFDISPATPKNIFGSPFTTVTTITTTAPTNQQNLCFINSQNSINPPEPNTGGMGGFKFDLVFPPLPPKIEETSPLILLAPETLQVNKQQKLEEELNRKEEEERANALEELNQRELKKEEQRKFEREKQEEKERTEAILKEQKKMQKEDELRRRLDELEKEAKNKHVEVTNTVKDVLTLLLNAVDNNIREDKLSRIKKKAEKNLIKKVFQEWKISVTKNKKKRKAVDCSPVWINSKTLEQSAKDLHASSQDLTLALIKRYKYGKPLDISYSFDDQIEKVNLLELTYLILKNRIYELTMKKPKNIFWKVVVSLPDKNELNTGLNRMEEAIENAFSFQKLQNKFVHLDHIKINVAESVSYCIEKQQGITVNEFDANGIIFIAKDFNTTLQRRIFENLRHFGVFTKIPIVVILQEYNPSKCKLENLIKEKIVSDYVVLTQNASAIKLVNAVEEGLVFLAKKVECSPPLELNTLKAFLTEYLCTEIWQRANSFAKWNSSYKKCLQNPNVVLTLYNEGLTRIKSIILNDFNKEHAVFPEEFKKYLKSEYPDFLPCSFRYFPKFWKTDMYLRKVEEVLNNLMLPKWSDSWPPPNEYELEVSVIKYSSKVTKHSEKLFYKIMSVMLQGVDPNLNFKDIQRVMWTDIIGLLGTEKLNDFGISLNEDFQSIFKEYFVVYNKNVASEFKLSDWFYICNKTIKKLVEEDLKRESKEVKTVVNNKIHMSVDFIDSLWNNCWSDKSKKSEMVKDLKELKKSLDGLAASMAVHKKISLKLEEHLINAIAEK